MGARGIERLSLDLAAPAAERWAGLAAHAEKARELLDCWLNDMGGVDLFAPLLDDYRREFVSDEHGAEIDAIAELVGRSSDEVLVGNIFYDAFRVILGCTAFAIDTPDGPLHARNLDWWSAQRMLSTHTLIFEASGGSCPGPYETVSWPGLIGTFSGVAVGRFAISLNACISDEHPKLAKSITLLLREVFDTCTSYEEAVGTLTNAPIAANSLLLVTGPSPGQMVVIERTSDGAAIREASDGVLVATNEFRALRGSTSTSHVHKLPATALVRYDRARKLALRHRPMTSGACMAILNDHELRLNLTVQQMVMQASTGLLEVRLPY